MLEGLFMLLALSALMAIASFLAGSLPLSFTLSQAQLRMVSAVGMGVLVGTSLVVIIPEGIETLYRATASSKHFARRDAYAPVLDVRWVDTGFHNTAIERALLQRSSEDEIEHIDLMPGPAIPKEIGDEGSADPPKTPTEPGVVHALGEEETTKETPSESEPTDDDSHDSESTPHAWVGISLISGFILMYLIDTLPSFRPPAPSQRMNIYSLSDLSSSAPSSPPVPSQPKASFSTTLGLVIHAAADGIALGASSTQPSLSFIIFFAIMVHKAPAAFGLTSVLLKQGLSKRQARSHLLAFSLAAPAGAIFTWLLVGILGGGGSPGGSTKWWTGVILLFSGGTFLYVAMHTMRDEASSIASEEPQSNGYLGVPQGRDVNRGKPQSSMKHTMAAVFGMLLPLITQVGHAS